MSEDPMFYNTDKVMGDVENDAKEHEEEEIDLGIEEEAPNETPEQRLIMKLKTQARINREYNQRLRRCLKREKEEKEQAIKDARAMGDEFIKMKSQLERLIKLVYNKYTRDSTEI